MYQHDYGANLYYKDEDAFIEMIELRDCNLHVVSNELGVAYSTVSKIERCITLQPWL